MYRKEIIMSSGTAFCRDLTTRYCIGNGIDIGAGGDPVIPTAVQIDLPEPEFSRYGHAFPVSIVPQFRSRDWHRNLPFKDATLDFVYSSHLLEDYNEWEELLKEWIRVIKPGGHILILVPDKVKFNEAVRRTGGGNAAHKHEFRVGELSEWFKKNTHFEILYDDIAGGSLNIDWNIAFIAKKP